MRLALLFFAALVASFACSYASAQAQQAPEPPNFVLIVADDMAASDLQHMTLTQEHLAAKGTTFSNALVSDPLCCPSRATILTGLYPHNHGIWSIYNERGGGFEGFRDRGLEERTVATWLDGAGYRTALMGKYFNGYNSRHIPPGWDEWLGMIGNFENRTMNDNGELVPLRGNQADLFAKEAGEFVGGSEEPFFLYIGTHAPHGPPDVASRHKRLFEGWKAPRTPAFNERDVSDKPAYVRQRAPLDGAKKKARRSVPLAAAFLTSRGRDGRLNR